MDLADRLLLLIRLAVSNTRWYRNVTYAHLLSIAGYKRRYEFSCRLYLRFRITCRFEISFKTTVRAVNVPATVLWDVDRIFVVNTTLRDATVIVLPYQVALRLQAAVQSGSCGLLTKMRPCCSHPHFTARHGCYRNPLHTRHTALTCPVGLPHVWQFKNETPRSAINF